MNNGPSSDEIISNSNDSFPEEIKQFFENQYENIPMFSENENLLSQNDLVDQVLNKMSTGESSNNSNYNTIEVNEREKAFEDNFPFQKHIIELEEDDESNKNFSKRKNLIKEEEKKRKIIKEKFIAKLLMIM